MTGAGHIVTAGPVPATSAMPTEAGAVPRDFSVSAWAKLTNTPTRDPDPKI
jgi:hypothetical protein